MATRGCLVTGTDTGVGKSIVTAALCAALRATGERVAAFKPVVTGLDEPAGEWPADHELLAEVTGADPASVTTATFGPAASPHLAAELAGVRLDVDALAAAAREAGRDADVLVVEGVGGLLVPLDGERTVRDLAVLLGLGVVVVARPGLGTVNHCLLTVEAARAARLDVRAVVLSGWPDEPSTVQRSNRETVARLSGVEVATLPVVRPTTADLAAAGAALPYARWIERRTWTSPL